MFARSLCVMASQPVQCPLDPCLMFQVDGLCVSQCLSCGILCGSFPITNADSLVVYAESKCTVVVGDMYIVDLPATVTRLALFSALSTIQFIYGSLFVSNNAFLPAMTFMSNLLGVDAVFYLNNPVLVDARLPALTRVSGNVTVSGCDPLDTRRLVQFQRTLAVPVWSCDMFLELQEMSLSTIFLSSRASLLESLQRTGLHCTCVCMRSHQYMRR